MVESVHTFILKFLVQAERATKSLEAIDKNLKTIGKTVDIAGKAVKNFRVDMLSMGLGMTFFMFGIQIQLRRMLRLMFNIFEEASGSTSILMEKFNMMRANLGAIAIAFFDAFAQSSLFDFLISVITRLAEWFLDLDDSTKAFITTLTVSLVAAFAIFSVGGQILLGIYLFQQIWTSIFGAGGKIATETAAGMGTTTTEGTTVGAFAKGLTLMRNLIGTGLVIKALFGIYKNITDAEPTPFWEILKLSLLAGVGVGVLTWNPIAGVLAGGIVMITMLLDNKKFKNQLEQVNQALRKKIFSPELLTAEDIGMGVTWQGTQSPAAAQAETARVQKEANIGGTFQIGEISKAIREGLDSGMLRLRDLIQPTPSTLS